jgi:hypothetical protein
MKLCKSDRNFVQPSVFSSCRLVDLNVTIHHNHTVADIAAPLRSRLLRMLTRASNARHHLAAESCREMHSKGKVNLRWRVRCMAGLVCAKKIVEKFPYLFF